MTHIESYVDLLFGDRRASNPAHSYYVAMGFGHEPYRDEKGLYRHRRWEEDQFSWPAERETLLIWVRKVIASGEPIDIYVCPALRNSAHRRGAGGKFGSNAAPLTVLWADCDTEPDAEKLAQLGAMVVASGQPGHAHVYVLLKHPIDVGTHKRLNKALANHLGADAKWSDEAVLRLPGTLNWKPTVPPAGVAARPPVRVMIQ